jgi:hypothetical protein
MLLSDYITQVQELVHDSSGIDYTQTEMTNFVNNARNRVALDFHCVRTLFAPLTTIVNQEIYPMYGGVGGALVTAGGTYAAAPAVTFAAPPAGGVTALGFPVMTGTAPNLTISSIAMTNWGSGYTSVPAVTISGGGGGAATAIVMLNVLDIVSISVINGIQRQTLLWAPFTKFQAFCRANTTITGQPLVWSNYTEQNRVFLYPALPDQNYVMEIDAVIGSATPLVQLTDVDTQILNPMSDCVQFYASHLALLKMQNFEQAEYYNKKYENRQMKIQLTRQTVRNPNVYQNNWRRVQRGW